MLTRSKRKREHSSEEDVETMEKKRKTDLLVDRKTFLITCLISFLHRDLLPIILNYVDTIEFKWISSFGTHGPNDGKLNDPSLLATQKDEIFVVDTSYTRIQIFEEKTGRFLRKISNWRNIVGTYEPYLRYGVVDILPVENEIIITESFVLLDNPPSLTILDSLNGKIKQTSEQGSDGLVHVSNGHRQYLYLTMKRFIIQVEYPELKKIAQFEKKELQNHDYLRKMCLYDNMLFVIHSSGISTFDLSTQTWTKTFSLGKPDYPEANQTYFHSFVVYGNQIIFCSCQHNVLFICDRETEKIKRSSSYPYWRLQPGLNQPQALCLSTRSQLLVCDSQQRVLVFE